MKKEKIKTVHISKIIHQKLKLKSVRENTPIIKLVDQILTMGLIEEEDD